MLRTAASASATAPRCPSVITSAVGALLAAASRDSLSLEARFSAATLLLASRSFLCSASSPSESHCSRNCRGRTRCSALSPATACSPETAAACSASAAEA